MATASCSDYLPSSAHPPHDVCASCKPPRLSGSQPAPSLEFRTRLLRRTSRSGLDPVMVPDDLEAGCADRPDQVAPSPVRASLDLGPSISLGKIWGYNSLTEPMFVSPAKRARPCVLRLISLNLCVRIYPDRSHQVVKESRGCPCAN